MRARKATPKKTKPPWTEVLGGGRVRAATPSNGLRMSRLPKTQDPASNVEPSPSSEASDELLSESGKTSSDISPGPRRAFLFRPKKAKTPARLLGEGLSEAPDRLASVEGARGGSSGCAHPGCPSREANTSAAREGGSRGGEKKKKTSEARPDEHQLVLSPSVSRETLGPTVGYVCPTCGVLSDLTPDGDPCDPDGRPWDRITTSIHGFRFRCYDCLGAF